MSTDIETLTKECNDYLDAKKKTWNRHGTGDLINAAIEWATNKIATLQSTPSVEEDGWMQLNLASPTNEGYYEVKYDDGTEDEKPFRIRPIKNIRGFMTERNVIYWRPIPKDKIQPDSEID